MTLFAYWGLRLPFASWARKVESVMMRVVFMVVLYSIHSLIFLRLTCNYSSEFSHTWYISLHSPPYSIEVRRGGREKINRKPKQWKGVGLGKKREFKKQARNEGEGGSGGRRRKERGSHCPESRVSRNHPLTHYQLVFSEFGDKAHALYINTFG